MLKKVLIGIVAFIALVALGGKLYIDYMDRQMDPQPLVERLAATPIPSEFVLVDEWHHRGSWLFKPREPEASRLYLASGTVDEVCRRLDEFYRQEGLEARDTLRSDSPPDWCGRSLRVGRGSVSIWVKPAESWWEAPAELSDQEPLTQLDFRAHR